MLDRRAFLRRGSIALAGSLLVGDAALEAFERLTHRKVFALGGMPEYGWVDVSDVEYAVESIPEGGYEAITHTTAPEWRWQSIVGMEPDTYLDPARWGRKSDGGMLRLFNPVTARLTVTPLDPARMS